MNVRYQFYGGLFDQDKVTERLQDLTIKSENPDFWSDQKNAKAVLSEKSLLEKRLSSYGSICEQFEDANTLLNMAEEEKTPKHGTRVKNY